MIKLLAVAFVKCTSFVHFTTQTTAQTKATAFGANQLLLTVLSSLVNSVGEARRAKANSCAQYFPSYT